MNFNLTYRSTELTTHIFGIFQARLLERGDSVTHYIHCEGTAEGGEDCLDHIGSILDLQILRIDRSQAIGVGESSFLQITVHHSGGRAYCSIEIWALNSEQGNRIKDLAKARLRIGLEISNRVIIQWYMRIDRTLHTRYVEQDITDVIIQSAYPWLPQGVEKFVENYLKADEPVLILFGPPGTGKTRLIRYILRAKSNIKRDAARVMYTTDIEVAQRDDFFIDYLINDTDFIVIEDADYLLESRADGNRDLHRFLTASDGLIKTESKKIIFSTNLSSKINIDPALTRPGRCFDCVASRNLTIEEIDQILRDMKISEDKIIGIMEDLFKNKSSYGISLAEVYCALNKKQ